MLLNFEFFKSTMPRFVERVWSSIITLTSFLTIKWHEFYTKTLISNYVIIYNWLILCVQKNLATMND